MDNVITFAHTIIKRYTNKDAIAIDATVGNGHDTVFLAKLVDTVYGFDIQERALKQTKELCEKHQIHNVHLFLDSHANIKQYLTKPVDAAMFNLGYLPNSDKKVTTKASSTIKAIEEICSLLKKGGVITVTIYIGHEEGIHEQKELEHFLERMDSSYTVMRYQHVNRPSAPYTICIQKR